MWGIGSLPPPPPPCLVCKRPICRCPKPPDPRSAADGRGLGDWHFAGLGGPGGPGDHPTRRGVKHPTFCRGFRGPRGRPDFSKRQMVIQISTVDPHRLNLHPSAAGEGGSPHGQRSATCPLGGSWFWLLFDHEHGRAVAQGGRVGDGGQAVQEGCHSTCMLSRPLPCSI